MSDQIVEAPERLQVAGVRYSYATQPVLAGVSFRLYGGEIAALIGRNGAGKSTLLRCIGGWTRPDAGRIVVDTVALLEREREARRVVTLVPDTPAFYDDLTAWEHLRFIAQAHRIAGWQPAADTLLERFGLANSRDATPQTFSRGMRYKLALCLALLTEPRLLLLDEPFGPLDPVSAEALWDILAETAEGGAAILLSSHQLPADALPDRYLVLEQGELLADGDPATLSERFQLREDHSLDDVLRAAIDQAPNQL